jgi:hypothetical protein
VISETAGIIVAQIVKHFGAAQFVLCVPVVKILRLVLTREYREGKVPSLAGLDGRLLNGPLSRAQRSLEILGRPRCDHMISC